MMREHEEFEVETDRAGEGRDSGPVTGFCLRLAAHSRMLNAV